MSELNDFQKIEKAVNLVEVAESYGIVFKKSGKGLEALSPFKDEKTASFKIYEKNGVIRFHDYSTNKDGNVINFVIEMENKNGKNLTSYEALKMLANTYNVKEVLNSNTFKSSNETNSKNSIYYEIMNDLFELYKQNLKNDRIAQGKIINRGYEPETFLNEKYHLGYANGREINELVKKYDIKDIANLKLLNEKNEGFQKDRIIFPVRNNQGQIVGFGGRGDDPRFKYLQSQNSPIYQKNQNLFAMLSTKATPVFLVEGFFDVYAINTKLDLNACATMGTSISEKQMNDLKNISNEVIICLDGDTAGQNATSKSLPKLIKEGFNVNIIKMPIGVDPDEYFKEGNPEEKLKELLSNNYYTPISYLYQKYEDECKNFVSYNLYFKNFVKDVAQILKLSPMEDKFSYLNEFSNLLNIDYKTANNFFPDLLEITTPYQGKTNNLLLDTTELEVKIFGFLIKEEKYDKLEVYKKNFDNELIKNECEFVKNETKNIDKISNLDRYNIFKKNMRTRFDELCT